ncbi:MAG: hypothetical protein JJU13_12365 [Balneolaceae bacterium]|nr:hypothetical protein [Balneolaceae bacterium]
MITAYRNCSIELEFTLSKGEEPFNAAPYAPYTFRLHTRQDRLLHTADLALNGSVLTAGLSSEIIDELPGSSRFDILYTLPTGGCGLLHAGTFTVGTPANPANAINGKLIIDVSGLELPGF